MNPTKTAFRPPFESALFPGSLWAGKPAPEPHRVVFPLGAGFGGGRDFSTSGVIASA